MLKRSHDLLLLRSFVLHQSCCPLFVYRLHNVHVPLLSSAAVAVNSVNCGDRRTGEWNGRERWPVPVTKRFYTALRHNLNVRPSVVPVLSSHDADLQWPVTILHSLRARGYSRPWPNVRWLTLSPKAIVEASPLYIQPYLRLIRLDRPIGRFLKLLSARFLFRDFVTLIFFTKK